MDTLAQTKLFASVHPEHYRAAYELEAHLIDAHFLRAHGGHSLDELVEIHDERHTVDKVMRPHIHNDDPVLQYRVVRKFGDDWQDEIEYEDIGDLHVDLPSMMRDQEEDVRFTVEARPVFGWETIEEVSR